MIVCSHCLSQAQPERAGALGPPAGMGGSLLPGEGASPCCPGLPPTFRLRPHRNPMHGDRQASQQAAGLFFTPSSFSSDGEFGNAVEYLENSGQKRRKRRKGIAVAELLPLSDNPLIPSLHFGEDSLRLL